LFEVYLRQERVEDAERLMASLPECDADGRAARARAALLKGDDATLASLMAGGRMDHPGMARIRGRLALLRGDGPAAERDFRSALATDPDDHETLQNLAKALRLAGDDAGSDAYLKRVRVQSQLRELVQRAARGNASADLTLLQSLGQACEAANRPREARAWYTLVIARNPLDSDAQHSLYRLSTAK
jgi:tetratricopeptide (TPR) repeat protein